MKSPLLESLCVALLAGTLAMGCAEVRRFQRQLIQLTVSDEQIQSVAKCLQEKKITLYGAEWCEPCQRQKEYFGEHFSRISYVECPDKLLGSLFSINEKCETLQSLPAWEFSDGKILYGVGLPEDLAELAGCESP